MRSPGVPATRFPASVRVSVWGKATSDPRRGQRAVVGSRRSQSPSASVGSMLAWRIAMRHGPRRRCRSDSVRQGPAARRGLGMRIGEGSAGAPGAPRLLLAAGRLPGGVDLIDHVEELLAVRGVGGRLHLRDLLVRVPEHLMQVRDLFEVLRLEVVVPEDVEVVLDQLRALFLDMDGAATERRILVGSVLLEDPVARLRLDASLL